MIYFMFSLKTKTLGMYFKLHYLYQDFLRQKNYLFKPYISRATQYKEEKHLIDKKTAVYLATSFCPPFSQYGT